MRIALFITCLGDNFLPRHGIAICKLLEHFGHEVSFPVAQTCCGQPFFNNGFHPEAASLALRMARVFEDYQWVVTPSASCAAMVRQHMPELFEAASAEAQQVQELAEKTFQFVEFLDSVLHVEIGGLGAKWQGRATYHPSCHLRTLGGDPCERFLSEIEGLDYRALPRSETCCGFGGSFAIKYPQISGAMVDDKLACIRSTAAETLVSNDPGCSITLATALAGSGGEISCVSFAEILAESLQLLPRTES